MNSLIATIITIFASGSPALPEVLTDKPEPLAEVSYSMNNRYGNEFVNEVFADNILLTMAYMRDEVASKEDIDWDKVRSPFVYDLTLKPGETFAFHEMVKPEYEGRVTKVTNAHFNAEQGFRFSGKLYGDGVCHLASFINVAAKRAGLEVESPVAHDFAKIPDVDRIDGVSIYFDPGSLSNSGRQNLYITNNQEEDVTFSFKYEDERLEIEVVKA